MEVTLSTSPDNSMLSDFASEDEREDLWGDHYELTSVFPENNVEAHSNWKNLEMWKLQQEGLVSILSQRMSYLDDLNQLQPGWISGACEVPSSWVLATTRKLLQYIADQARKRILNVIPRIVMGPLPQGGIEVELHAEQDTALYVTMNNDESVEINTEYHGYYASLDTKAIGIGDRVLAYYESLSEK